jgi:hypothetical protein
MNLMHRLSFPTFILVLMIASVGPARGQIATGDIVGRITDSTGAALPGAAVTALNTGTGLSRSTVSGGDGLYRLVSLPPGLYTLKVEFGGFQTRTVENLRLNVGAEMTQNVTLPLAGVEESLTVSAEAPLVEPTNPTVHEVVTPEAVRSLPLNSRNFAELAVLVAGVDFDDTEEEEQDAQGQVQFAAQPSRNTLFMVDGADTTTEGFGGNQVFFSQDAIEEFRVIPANWPAEFGRTNAGVVQVITKSGTNEVKGTAFGFFRDKTFNARGEFEEEKPEFSRQQFGGVIGGPITRDRTHYFVSYEQQRQREFATVTTFGVYPEEEGSFAQPVDNYLFLGKFNHQLSDRQRLTFKYALDARRDRNVGVGGFRALSNGGNDDENRQHLVASHSWAATSSLLNEVTFGFVNRRSTSFRTSAGPELFYPSIILGGNNDYGVDFLERKYHLRDDVILSWDRRGQHTTKFGYEFIDARDTGPYPLFLPGAFFFSDDRATVPDFGLVASEVFDEGNRVANHGFYVQDDWRISSRLTLNLGLRYDFQLNALNESERLPSSDRLGRPRPETDYNNLAPRFGFAFDLTGEGKSVLRGGSGVYYDQILPNIPFLEILSNSPVSIFFVIAPSDLNDPVNSSLFAEATGPTTTLDVLAPDFETPYAIISSVGWTQRLTPRLAIDVDYLRALGRNEFYNRPINFNPAGPPPYPGFGRIRQFETSGRSDYQALQIKVNQRGARSGALVSYTLAEATNFADDFRRQPPSDPFNIAAEEARSGTVARHRFVASGYASLPGGFLLSGILTARSGQPYNIILGVDANRDGFNQDRPAGLPRNSGDGPSFMSLDVRVVKSFRLSSAGELQLLWEAFNLTNRVNYDDPVRVLSSPNVGQFTQALPPFQMQLGVRVVF